MIYAGFVIQYFDSKNNYHWTKVFNTYQEVLDEQKRLINVGMHNVVYYRLVKELNQCIN